MFKYSIGNSKIGKDTLIFNITSATECPSKKLGLCQLCDSSKCYALKAERMYKQVLPYRRQQAIYWAKTSLSRRVYDIFWTKERHKAVKYIRINDSGDLRTQKDFDDIKDIARAIPEVVFYLYTARKDLNLKHNVKNLVVNGSGFMADNCFKVLYKGENKLFREDLCPGSCSNCTLCKKAQGRVIRVLAH